MNSLPPEQAEDNRSPFEIHQAALDECKVQYGEAPYYVHRPLHNEDRAHGSQRPEECTAWMSFLFTADRRIVCVTTDPAGTSTGEVDVDFYEQNRGPYPQFHMERFILDQYRLR